MFSLAYENDWHCFESKHVFTRNKMGTLRHTESFAAMANDCNEDYDHREVEHLRTLSVDLLISYDLN